MIILTDIEQRVLGALVEKQISTPEYYPLSLNALVNACNQKNHRDPVVSYVETEVRRAFESLRDKGLAYVLAAADARVPKYGHNFPKVLELDAGQTAILTVLMLRGPQTPGELRSRTPHLHEFESLPALEETLLGLTTRAEPLVRKLPRAPGTKEARYAQLLGGEVKGEAVELLTAEVPPVSAPLPLTGGQGRIESLAAEIAVLKQQLLNFEARVSELESRLK